MRPTYLPPRWPAVLTVLVSAVLAGVFSSAFAALSGSSAPTASPDMVFASDRDGNAEIYAMRSDGRLQNRLTVDPAADIDPAISGSGLVVFASDRAGSFDLYAMSSEGRAVTRLTSLVGDETQPAFSPDGSKVAFSHDGDVFVMNANGRQLRNVTSHPAHDADPSWSPDGRRIAFASDRGGSREIFVLRLGQRRATALTRSGDNSAPDWSPDGAGIAFEHGSDVHAVSAAGAAESLVAADTSAPSFSPDGAELAVADGRDVVRVSLSGDLVANLSFSAAIDGAPDWRGGSR
jgi:Tol biopolymer transport system component